MSDNSEFLLAASLMARPDFASGVSLKKVANQTVCAIITILQENGEVFAAPSGMVSALKDREDLFADQAEAISIFKLIPPPDSVSMKNILELSKVIAKVYDDKAFASRLTNITYKITKGGEAPVDQVPAIRKLIDDYSAGATDEEQTATAILDRLKNGKPTIRYAVGLDSFDYLFPGITIDDKPGYGLLGAGEVLGLSAPPKNNKTRMMINWLVPLLSQGASIGWFTLEDNELSCALKLMGVKFRIYPRHLEWFIHFGPEEAARSYQNPKDFIKRCTEAVAWYASLGDQLRIYDRSNSRFAITSTDSLIEAMQVDVNRYGTKVQVIDYLQRLGDTPELLSDASKRVTDHAGRNKVAIIELLQWSGETQKWGSPDGQLSAKGSTTISQDVHTGIEITADPALAGAECKLKIKIAREGPGTTTFVQFDLMSGQLNINSNGLNYYDHSEYSDSGFKPKSTSTYKKKEK